MKKLALKIAVIITAMTPLVALAAEDPDEILPGVIPPTSLKSPINSPTEVVTTLNTISGWLFTIFFALAIVFLIYAAFVYLTAGGNETRVGSAKNILIYAIVAIVVALVAGGIPLFVAGLLGVTP